MTLACQGNHLFKLKSAAHKNNLGVFEPVPEDGEGELAHSSFKELPKRSRVSYRRGIFVSG